MVTLMMAWHVLMKPVFSACHRMPNTGTVQGPVSTMLLSRNALGSTI